MHSHVSPVSHGGPSAPPVRLEAFSDGVFAIAITLLIIEIRLPAEGEIHAMGGLTTALVRLWPSYAGYVISFLTIGIMWANHHNLVRLLTGVDHGFVIWNLLLLMAIAFVPFSTAVMAEHLHHPGHDRNVAVAFYAATFAVTAVFYNGLWWHAARGRRLIAPHVSDARVAAVTRAFWPGIVTYVTAAALSFVSVALALAILAGIDIFYILPKRGAHGEPA